MSLVLDFDGTIVDVWVRFYTIFCDLTHGDHPSLWAYREAKLRWPDDKVLASIFGLEMNAGYKQKKRALLEDDEYLEKDSLLIDAASLREAMDADGGLVLSRRRNRGAFDRELKRLGLQTIAPRCHLLNPDSGVTKREWVTDRLGGIGQRDFLKEGGVYFACGWRA